METAERISVGLLVMGKNESTYLYSQKKLDAIQHLFPAKVFDFYSKTIKNLDSKTLSNESNLDYMIRYSNNLLSFSNIKSIDIEYSQETAQRLFKNYIEQTIA